MELVKDLRLPENLEEAQVRSLAVALKSNTSIETIMVYRQSHGLRWG